MPMASAAVTPITMNQQYYMDQEDLYRKNIWKEAQDDGEYSNYIYSFAMIHVPCGIKLTETEVNKILNDLHVSMGKTSMGYVFLNKRDYAEILGKSMLNNEYSQQEMDQFQHDKCVRVYLIEMIRDLHFGSGEVCIKEVDDDELLIHDLLSFFWNVRPEAEKFVHAIRGAKPTQITAAVRELVKRNIVCETSSKHDFWLVMFTRNRYPCSKSNWNAQVKL